MTWTFTQVSPNLLRITANDRDGNGSFTTNLVVSGRVDSFRIYASQMQGGDAAQPYFNDFAVTAASATDSNGNGLPDWWELGYFGDLTKTGTGDEDSDGLSNAGEYAARTNPNVADTDGDGLKDGFEAGTSGYQVVLGSFTWDTARLHAIAKGGHLATITSELEKTNIAAAVTEAEMSELWLGGYKSGTNWSWVTGETWDESAYNNWMPGEPGATDGQNYLRLKTFAEGWDNWFSTPTFSTLPVTIRGYLLEKSQTTDPLKFNHPLVTVTGTFQNWKAEPFPTDAPVNVMTPGTGTNQFVRTLDFNFPNVAKYVGKFANGQVFTNSNNINWGTSGTAGVAQVGGTGNDIPFNITSIGWWTFTFNTDTLTYGFARKIFPDYLSFSAAYNLPAAGSGGGENEDYEGDGLTNAEEFAANTNPTSRDTDGDTVSDRQELKIVFPGQSGSTDPLLADTDGDTLPDWWEINNTLNALSSAGDNGPGGNPDGDAFTNKQEFDGQSNPKSASSVPANRWVTFSLDLNRQISANSFQTNSHTVEVWGTFNDWGKSTNTTNSFRLTNNGSGIYSVTYPVVGAQGSTNLYQFVTFPSSNNAVWETSGDRRLVMGANNVATNLTTAYLGEVRPVNFSVNLGVQVALGRFSHGTNSKVYVVGDVDGGWNPGTELTRVGSTDVYSGNAFVSGSPGATNSYKFRVNSSLGYEIDLDPATTGDQTRQLILGARDLVQTNAEVFFNNVTNAPANRTVTFAVNMNVQTNSGKLAFDPAKDYVELRGDFNGFGGGVSGGVDWRLTNNGSGIFTGSFVLVGDEGSTNAYKYVAMIVSATNTNAVWERVDIPRATNTAQLNRTFVLGVTNTNQTVHSVASPAWFSIDDGKAPSITLNGANPLNLTNGAIFVDPGATVADEAEGTSTGITGTGSVDTSVAGTYNITYNASDAAGNAAPQVTRTVIVAAAPSGSTFSGWGGGVALDAASLGKYAIGGATNFSANSEKPLATVDSNTLSLSAIVRTNDTNLTVVGEAGGSLTNWSTSGVSVTASTNTNGVPDGCQRRVFSVDRTNSPTKQFLRLKATLAP